MRQVQIYETMARLGIPTELTIGSVQKKIHGEQLARLNR
jgi:hypothetical protein